MRNTQKYAGLWLLLVLLTAALPVCRQLGTANPAAGLQRYPAQVSAGAQHGLRTPAVGRRAQPVSVSGAVQVYTETREQIPLPVIMYHSLLDDPATPSAYVLSPAAFESDVRWLLANGYTPVSAAAVLEYWELGIKLPEKPVMLTFDDGFYNYLPNLLPILEKYEIPALVNVVGSFTQQAEADPDKHPAYAYLDWDDLRVLTAEGWVELGNHSYAMHSQSPRLGASRIRGEALDAYRATLLQDTDTMQQLLYRKLGVTPRVYAYPYGAVSEGAAELLNGMGFDMLLTCCEHPNFLSREPDSLRALGRYNRDSRLTTEEFMHRLLAGYGSAAAD